MEERLPEAAGDDFRSCCGDDEEWEDTEESFAAGVELDEASVRLFFKGVSSTEAEGKGKKRLSGIGVVMERSPGVPVLKVQKKLDFYVDELVAEHLALMDGLLVALQNGIRKIFAFTNSEKLYFQIAEAEILEDQLLVALGHRILELVDKLEDFDLILLPSFELERPLRLAKEAIGVRYVSPYEVGTCPMCCQEKLGSQMIKAGCSHTFCYSCLTAYVEERLQSSKLPIRCPHLRCKYRFSASECKSFLPVSSYDSLERAFAEAGNSGMERFYCPFPNCSVLLDLSQHFSRACSSSQSDLSCVECPECHRDICVNCGVPWHIMMGCDEYQSLPVEERDAGDLSLHQLAQNNSWRRCQRCQQMIELTQGCFYMTCCVAMSSATHVVLNMPMVYRHANVCSGMKVALSLPPQRNPAKQHLRYGHGTHSTACQLLLRGTQSRKELNWHSSRGSSPGVLAWETTRASHHLAAPTLTLLTP